MKDWLKEIIVTDLNIPGAPVSRSAGSYVISGFNLRFRCYDGS
jgi:hypothetical protein